MGTLPPYTTIHLLAGTYQTYGGSAYLVKSGQKILGSGMDVTILQFPVGATDNTAFFTGGSLTNIEISDLTCDANYGGGAVTYNGIDIAEPKWLREELK